MDYSNNHNPEPWEMEWQGDDCYLQRDSRIDISSSLWDEVNQNEDDLLCLLNEMTPVKACGDINYSISDNGEWYSEDLDKELEEHLDSSQMKRRRMLQFNSNDNNAYVCNEETAAASVVLEDRENLMEDMLADNMQCITSFSDDRYTSSYECCDQSPERFLANCLNDNEMHFNYSEMNASATSYNQVEISDYSNAPPVRQTHMVKEAVSPAPRSVFKVISGRKSYMRNPTKSATSVAYPFALIKPCGVRGDVTLKDINQRIRTPPPLRSKTKGEEEATPSYPTSAFSGKPVVLKTKIRTEGGKGSITIMRTRG